MKKLTTETTARVYTQACKEQGTIKLPEAVFAVPMNENLVHDVVVMMQGNARTNSAHTKNRGEVRGGGKKPWQQKGTGRARHGSSRSPIWAGGGVAHGPRNERDYTRKINKNTRAKAFACVLTAKQQQSGIIFIDDMVIEKAKAKDARAFLTACGTVPGHEDVSTRTKNAALIVLPERDEQVELSFRNFGNVMVTNAKDVDIVTLLTYKHVIVAKPEASLEIFSNRVKTKTARKVVTTA